VQDVNDLMWHLIDVWDGVKQSVIGDATNQRRRGIPVCLWATEAHFEYWLWHILVKNV